MKKPSSGGFFVSGCCDPLSQAPRQSMKVTLPSAREPTRARDSTR